jgi:hypothetical protein
MSTFVAVLCALGLYCALALPAVLSLYARAGLLSLVFYGAAGLALGAHHVGFDVGRARPQVQLGAGGQFPEGACEQALSASQDAGLLLDRRDPARIVVNGSLWQQLPQQVRDVLVGCLGEAAPEGAEVQIIERAPS